MAEIYHFEKIFDFPKWMPDKYFLRKYLNFGKDSSLQGVTGKRGNQHAFSDSWEKESKTVNRLDSRQLWYTFSYAA